VPSQSVELAIDAAAWTVADIGELDRLSVSFGSSEIAEMRSVVAIASANGFTAEDAPDALFQWPLVDAKVRKAYPELQRGRGLVVLKGLPADEFSDDDLAVVFWGIGLSIGSSVSQSAKGDRIGHVRDMSALDHNARAYQNKNPLNPHTDHTEVVGLLCLRASRSGGATPVASALAIHNEMLETRPDLLPVLYRGFRYHRRGEEQPGDDPMTPHRVPVFSRVGSSVSCRLIRPYIDAAAAELGEPLTPEEVEALDLVQSLANDPRFCLELQLEPGTLLLFNNYTVIHGRRPFQDDVDPNHQRHLLRMWLVPKDFRAVVPEIELYSTKGGIAPREVASTVTFHWGVGTR
jgi:alpha-ketoglutarate-dependent taurine dioxygenase